MLKFGVPVSGSGLRSAGSGLGFQGLGFRGGAPGSQRL